MSMVTFSVDTNTRQAVVTVNGEIIPAIACRMNKWIDFDGEPHINLSYVVETNNQDGLVERREFFLPDPDDDAVFASVEDGLASRDFEGDTKDLSVRDSIVRWMESRKKSKKY